MVLVQGSKTILDWFIRKVILESEVGPSYNLTSFGQGLQSKMENNRRYRIGVGEEESTPPFKRREGTEVEIP